MKRQDLRWIQWHYQRLRANQPQLSHKELWRQAELAASSMSDAASSTSDRAPAGQGLHDVEMEYARLRAAHPDVSHLNLWSQAKRAVASSDGSSVDGVTGSGRDANPLSPQRHSLEAEYTARYPQNQQDLKDRRYSRRAIAGFILVGVATVFATVTPFWLAWDPCSWAPAVLWLATVLLGTVSLVLLGSAIGRINRSPSGEKGMPLVVAGLTLAVFGSLESALVAILSGGAM